MDNLEYSVNLAWMFLETRGERDASKKGNPTEQESEPRSQPRTWKLGRYERRTLEHNPHAGCGANRNVLSTGRD